MNQELVTQINGKKITASSHREFVKSCLQEIVDMYRDLPKEERLKSYINYFVDNFNYDFDLRNHVLSKEYEGTSAGYQQHLSNLFISKNGVCHQFAQAFSLLSCLDNEINTLYCFCKLLVNNEKEVTHAINLAAIDGNVEIVDLSSMIHAREGDFGQEKNAFCGVDLLNYIDALKKEDIDFLPEEGRNSYCLGACKYLKDFDKNYLVLNATDSFLNEHNLGYILWEEPIPTNNKKIDEIEK